MNHAESEQTQESDPKVMGLMEHLGELRSRLFKSFIAIIGLFALAMSYSTPILEYLKMPLRQAMPDQAKLLHFTSPLEPFIAQMKVSLLFAFIFGCPIWIYQFWRFVEPALYDNEKKFVLPFTFASVVLFLVASASAFTLCYPLA